MILSNNQCQATLEQGSVKERAILRDLLMRMATLKEKRRGLRLGLLKQRGFEKGLQKEKLREIRLLKD